MTLIKSIISTHSLPLTNSYKFEFEDNIKSLKGSVPTTNEFDYHQQGGGGIIIKSNGPVERMPNPKEPQSGQFYAVICNAEGNKIDTLIEINENDLSLF